jgi:hypothetical protein
VYSSYTAASFPREFELAEKHGVNFEGALKWVFEFEDQPPSQNSIRTYDPSLNIHGTISR